MYALAFVLKYLHPEQIYPLALPRATSANQVLPLQQDFKHSFSFSPWMRFASHFFSLCIMQLPGVAWGRWDTFFCKPLSLAGQAYCSCLPLLSLCFSPSASAGVRPAWCGVLAQCLLLCFPSSWYMRRRIKGPCLQFLARMLHHLYQHYAR